VASDVMISKRQVVVLKKLK